jgi:membrane peptidoglycan carboxypeptidase
VPGKIWQSFMNKALQGTQNEKFPKPKPLNQFNPPQKSAPPSSNSQPNTPPSKPNDNSTEPVKPPSSRPTRPPGCGQLICPPSDTLEPSQPNPGNGGRDPGDT